MLASDRGLILRTHPLRETSKIVGVFGRTSGRVRLVARGARAPRSRLGFGLEAGNEVEYIYDLKPGRELGSLREASLRRSWLSGTRRMEVLGLGFAVLELLDRLVPEGASEPDLLEASLQAFADLHASPDRPRAIDVFYGFEIRLLERSGLLPNLERCDDCGVAQPESASLDTRAGAFRCRRCSGSRPGSVDLDPEALELFRGMVPGGRREAPDRAAGPRARRILGICLHRLLGAHLERYRYPQALRLLSKKDTMGTTPIRAASGTYAPTSS